MVSNRHTSLSELVKPFSFYAKCKFQFIKYSNRSNLWDSTHSKWCMWCVLLWHPSSNCVSAEVVVPVTINGKQLLPLIGTHTRWVSSTNLCTKHHTILLNATIIIKIESIAWADTVHSSVPEIYECRLCSSVETRPNPIALMIISECRPLKSFGSSLYRLYHSISGLRDTLFFFFFFL